MRTLTADRYRGRIKVFLNGEDVTDGCTEVEGPNKAGDECLGWVETFDHDPPQIDPVLRDEVAKRWHWGAVRWEWKPDSEWWSNAN